MSVVPGSNLGALSARDFQPSNSLWKLRPTFEFGLAEARASAIEKLQAEFQRSDGDGLFLMHGEYGELHLPPESHRLWSPHLSFYLTEHDEQTWIYGRFAPRIEVWTFVWVIYLAMACTAFFSLLYALSQLMLGEWSWAGFGIALASLASIVILNVVAHVGQHWSADQMGMLRGQLEEILQQAGVAR